jgi:hypothetical protein
MYKKLLLLLMAVSITMIGYCQISTGKMPRTFKMDGINLSTINTITITKPDMEQVNEQDNVNDTMFKLRRCSVIIPVKENFFDKATHISLTDADLYLVRIKSQDAQALNLYSSDFFLPKGGELYLYNEEHSKVIGGFTSENNDESGTFATDYIYGDEMILEYYQPKTVSQTARIELGAISYFYRDVEDPSIFTKTNSDEYGASGSCEVNVNCSEGDNYRNQQRGVCRIYLIMDSYSAGWCTGTLINNTNMDKKPYIISAAHCVQSLSSSSYYNYFVFYFNYETSGCSNPTTEPTSRTMTGATLKAYDNTFGQTGSDFLLMQLKSAVPQSYNPYWCGWTRSTTASTSGVGIHHPAGDVKKISTYTTALQTSSYSSNPNPTHWKVAWAQTTNGYGVTEGGSSGSALFNAQGKIVGTLSGGYSSCTATTSQKIDWYGKFSYHWNSNGTATERQIATFLDPTNSGVTELGGMDYNSSITDINNSENNMSFSVYPNPSYDFVKISLNNNTEKSTINVIDYLGRVVYSQDIPQNEKEITINTTNLEKGSYVVEIMSNQTKLSKKIIVK